MSKIYAFWCYLKRCFGSWNCLENFECKEASWCIQTLFETIFKEFWETAGNILRARSKLGAFWCYLKRCLGSWNCLHNVETKEAKCCIRTLFKKCGPRLSCELYSIECRNMFITEITRNMTIRYNLKLFASRCFFFITSNIRFLNTPVYL